MHDAFSKHSPTFANPNHADDKSAVTSIQEAYDAHMYIHQGNGALRILLRDTHVYPRFLRTPIPTAYCMYISVEFMHCMEDIPH